VSRMSEVLASGPPIEENVAGGAFQRRMMRVRRTASLVGLVGVRQGVPMLAERLINPNADDLHTIRIKELEHPVHLTAAHSDIAMLNEIVGMRIYDLPGLEDKIDGNLIVDLGANIGVAASLFATRYPRSRVLAVEPHPRNVSLLERNLAAYDGRITAIPKAIGLESGRIGLVNPDVSNMGHHAVYEFRTGQSDDGIAAEALTPEELIDLVEQQITHHGRIGLLKMNIEGEEKGLLASRRMDLLLQRTNVAIIEAHDRKLDGTSATVLTAAARTGLRQFDRRGSYYFFQSER